MEGKAARATTLFRSNLFLLLLLMSLTVGLRAWQIAHTEVTSTDSIAYIEYAWRLEHQPWGEVLRSADRHPGYPAAIAATAQLVRPFVSGAESFILQLSAQLASALASVLLVLPMFYLGRELFNRAVGFWACVLYQCLPSSSLVLADGLSEALFLLLAVTAIWTAVLALRRGSPGCFALCGLTGGLAYLTRPEGVLVVAVSGLVLIASQGVAGWRRSWGRVVVCGLSLTLGMVLVGGPYVAVTGRLTVKPSARAIVDPPTPRKIRAERSPRPLIAFTAAANEPEGADRCWRSLGGVSLEIAEGYFYVGWVPLLMGLWWFRDRFRTTPGAWVPLLVGLALVLLLWRVAMIYGYASDRHLLLALLCGVYWMAAGLLEFPRRLEAVLPHLPRLLQRPVALVAHARFAHLVLLLLTAATLPKSLACTHPERAAYRAAGVWLAAHTASDDVIVDPYRWSSYYAGKLFEENQAAYVAQPGRTRYVIVPSPAPEKSNRPQVAKALRLAAEGEEVYRAPATGRKGRTLEVVIYAVSNSTL